MHKRSTIFLISIFLGVISYFLGGAIFLLLLFGGICYVIYRNTDAGIRDTVLRIMITGFAVRVILAVVLHAYAFTKGFHSVSGDDLLYIVKSWSLVHRWEAKPETWAQCITSASREYGINPFTYLLASFYKIFGFHPVSGKLLNCIFGTLIGWVAYLIAEKIFDRRSAVIALAVVVFYPSLIRWSVANLKDSLMILLFMVCIYLLIEAICSRIAAWKYVILGFSIFFLFMFTQILYCLLATVGLAIMVMMKLLNLFKGRALKTAFITMVIGGFFMLVFYFVYIDTKPLIKILYMCEETQSGISKSDLAGYYFYQTGFMTDMNKGIINLPQLFIIMFMNIIYFLLTPFPWQMTSFDRLLALPQMFLWYAVLGLAVFGFFRLVLRSPGVAFLTAAVLILGISVNSMAEGNIGAAFRHRDVFTPLLVIMASGIMSELLRGEKISGKGMP